MSLEVKRKFCLTVDVEPDQNKEGKFGSPLSFKGVLAGAVFLRRIVEDMPMTLFVSGRCLEVEDENTLKLLEIFPDAEIGVLFNYGDYPPKKERIEGGSYSVNSFDVPLPLLRSSLTNCWALFQSKGLSPKSIRFGGASVNVDILEWLGDSELFTHSSSTVPGLMSNDKKIDHRLYKHDPYRVGNLVEVPLSIYGSDRTGWVSPVIGFGLLDNVQEIMRKVPVVVANLSLRDLVFGSSPFLMEEEDAEVVQNRLETFLYFVNKFDLGPVKVADITPISDSF